MVKSHPAQILRELINRDEIVQAVNSNFIHKGFNLLLDN